MGEIISFTQYGLWGDDKIIVPKKRLPTIPDWAQVALNGWHKGWKRWLSFWGIERIHKVKAFSNGLDSPIAGSVPGFIERQALRNLVEQAGLLVVAKGTTKLTLIDKTLVKLERYYLNNYERISFAVTYDAFRRHWLATDRTTNPIKLQDTHRYLWIADRMGMYRMATIEVERAGETVAITDHWPAAHEIANMLDVASARMELLEKSGQIYDIDVDITRLLRTQKRKAA